MLWFLEREWKEIPSDVEQDTESQSQLQRVQTSLRQVPVLGSLCLSLLVPGPWGELQLSLGLCP